MGYEDFINEVSKDKFVELTTKQDGNTNPVMIFLADIAVIQAEGILSGNTKIVLRGSGKSIQIPESYYDVKEKILSVLNGENNDKYKEDKSEKRYLFLHGASYNNRKVFRDKKTGEYYGAIDANNNIFYCVPVSYYGLKDIRTKIGGKVMTIEALDVQY